jgi:uncharacterized integral membrane protein (TIGR00698 family)
LTEQAPLFDAAPSLVRRPQWLPARLDVPGLGLAAVVGALALAVIRLLPPSPFLSDVLIALLLGALILNTPLRLLIGLSPPTLEREPDRYAAGVRFTGKWVLRASIILMGFKVRTQDFGLTQFAVIAGVAAVTLPSTFFITHAAATVFGVRRPMADLVAGGTMICGASAVNAVAPIAGARRDEQGIAIATIFLFSVVALLVFRPIAALIGLDPISAGLWSGLAVNDLSSAIAVGKQMGEIGGAMAAASKSTRVLLLAPTLIVLALLRRDSAPKDVQKSAVSLLPRYLFGYIALALIRVVGDRVAEGTGAWNAIIAADRFAVDWLMATVAAAIGLHLELRSLLSAGARALAVGGAASCWMAALSLAMIVASSRGAPATAALIAGVALVFSVVVYRAATTAEAQTRELRRRFESGAPLSLAETMRLLSALEADGRIEDVALRKVLAQLYPSIGELIPVRKSPLPHGEGCRWITYWEGRSGWALVAVCRDPGSTTPIHAHSHRLLGKTIEGLLEELRFSERGEDVLELTSRKVLAHNDLVETDGLATPHVVRALGDRAAIDLQLRGPEVGSPGRRFQTRVPLDFDALRVGQQVVTIVDIDDRPGQAGEGAKAGRVPALG